MQSRLLLSSFINMFLDGFGGNGTNSSDYCVQTGPFNSSSWSPPAPEDTSSVLVALGDIIGRCDAVDKVNASRPYKKCLRRCFNHVPSTLAHVLQTIETPCEKFLNFDKMVRLHYHNEIHNEVG